jgi:threonine synthase
MWRYREALPLDDGVEVVTLGEGETPMIPYETVGGQTIWIKQEQLFPSGSTKDRGAAVLISHLKSLGVGQVVEDSSGNAGSAVAAYCARAGIDCRIFVPQSTSKGKLAQISACRAHLELVPGDREAAALAAMKLAQSICYASHCWSPFFFHGAKTLAYEISDQFGWDVPDQIVLPVGNGTLLLGAYLGFKELMTAGITMRMPALIGVQSAEVDPLRREFERSNDPEVVNFGKTVAEGIAVTRPLRGTQIVDAVRKTGGRIIALPEETIISTWQKLQGEGFYIEPTAAVAFAGAQQLLHDSAYEPGRMVTVFSGHGLKSGQKMA